MLKNSAPSQASSFSDPPIRILVAATSFPRHDGDWQGLFIERQVSALARLPALHVSFWGPAGPRPTNVRYVAHQADERLLGSIGRQGGIAHLLRRYPVRGLLRGAQLTRSLSACLRRESESTDVYHLNWLQTALALAGTKRPALITVLGADYRLLNMPAMAMWLRRVFTKRRVILAPNAQWMESGLRDRFATCCEDIATVVFGVDTNWFEIKREPQSPCRWITVLRVTEKKIGPYFEWVRSAAQRGHEFHLFGPMQEQIPIPSWVRYHGSVTPPELARKWYPAATGMISLSQHDEGRPQVLLEAMASGLPIIASGIPAHRDLFAHQDTAELVSSAEEFHHALGKLSQREHGMAIGSRARASARESFGTWDDCALRYKALYDRLLTPKG